MRSLLGHLRGSIHEITLSEGYGIVLLKDEGLILCNMIQGNSRVEEDERVIVYPHNGVPANTFLNVHAIPIAGSKGRYSGSNGASGKNTPFHRLRHFPKVLAMISVQCTGYLQDAWSAFLFISNTMVKLLYRSDRDCTRLT